MCAHISRRRSGSDRADSSMASCALKRQSLRVPDWAGLVRTEALAGERPELNRGLRQPIVFWASQVARRFVLAEEVAEYCRDSVGLTAVVWGGVARAA